MVVRLILALSILASLLLTGACNRKAGSDAKSPGKLCSGEAECLSRCAPKQPTACYALLFLRSKNVASDRSAAQAADKLEQSCDAQNSDGCRLYGAALLEGLGMKSDPPRATQAFERACELGRAADCALSGQIYREGRHVPQDFKRARELLNRGCKLKNGPSC